MKNNVIELEKLNLNERKELLAKLLASVPWVLPVKIEIKK